MMRCPSTITFFNVIRVPNRHLTIMVMIINLRSRVYARDDAKGILNPASIHPWILFNKALNSLKV